MREGTVVIALCAGVTKRQASAHSKSGGTQQDLQGIFCDSVRSEGH